jgi:hypothetical protein
MASSSDIELTLTRSEALDLIYAVIESTQEFMAEYRCTESERLSNALRSIFRLIDALAAADEFERTAEIAAE